VESSADDDGPVVVTAALAAVEVAESGAGPGARTVVAMVDPTAGRDECGMRVRVDAAGLVAAAGGCDVALRHGDGGPLARSGARTLELREVDGRVRVWARLGATSAADDLAIMLERGDVDTAGLELVAGEERWAAEDGEPLREVLHVVAVVAVVLGPPAVDGGRVARHRLAAVRRRARAALAEHGRPGRS